MLACVLPHAVLCAGGDSVSALKQLQPTPAMSYVSTGGGASLELLRGALLPGLTAMAEAAARSGPAS
jgi:phosphoglycerate kinase